MTIEQYMKASSLFKEMEKINGRLENIIDAHEVVQKGKVDKLILIGKRADLTPVEIPIEISHDILHEAIDNAWNKLGGDIENIKDAIKDI
jgi:hypothetical protein